MTTSPEQVSFPFAQALPAAAALWKLAQSIINDVEPARQKAAATAETQFSGTYADQFAQRMKTSATNAGNTAQDLEQLARNIAQAWSDASHQQQVYNYFAMVKDKRDHQSTLSKVGDWISGDHENYGSQPPPPAVPQPPDFSPTTVPLATVPGESICA